MARSFNELHSDILDLSDNFNFYNVLPTDEVSLAPATLGRILEVIDNVYDDTYEFRFHWVCNFTCTVTWSSEVCPDHEHLAFVLINKNYI